MKSILRILTALIIFAATASPGSQNVRVERSKLFILSQPDAPVLLHDLSIRINSKSPAFAKISFYVKNKSDKKIYQCMFDAPYIDGSGGAVTRVSSINSNPGEDKLEGDILYKVNSKPAVLRIILVKYEDGSQWQAPVFKTLREVKRFQRKPRSNNSFNPTPR